jgi:transposase
MNDVELYRQILGITAPWTVTRVELALDRGAVEVFVEHADAVKFACPKCGAECAVHDHTAARTWRHLDTCQYRTLLHARPPRIRCNEHGVLQAELPWAGPRSRFTLMFEGFAIDVLQATDVANAAAILGISWDEAFGIMNRAVRRGLDRRGAVEIATIGIDEKSPGKGQRMFTIVSDIKERKVTWVGDGHGGDTLDVYWKSRTPEQIDAIRTITMDMSGAYFGSTLRCVPGAAQMIVFDRFHVMQHASKAVDTVRRNEHFAMSRDGESALKGTRYMWLFGKENVPEKYEERFAALRRVTTQTGRAWVLKEDLRSLWDMNDLAEARTWLSRWVSRAKRSLLAPMRKLAGTIVDHRDNILTYLAHRVTNAAAEGLNSAIQAIKVRARGYRNRENFKTAIYFHLGGLEMNPSLAAQTS